MPLTPKEETPARRGWPLASQGLASVSSSIAPADQSTCVDGRSTWRVLRQRPLAQRHHHLDHPGDPGRGRGVADVGLDRAQPQRLDPILAVGGEQRPASIGSPRVVPVPWASTASTSPGARPALARAWRITRSCEGPLGAVRPLEAPSWLTALPADRGEDRVAVALGLESRSSTSIPAPSAKPVPSAASAKALQRPSGGEAALAADVDEAAGVDMHHDAPGQRQRALAAAQRLAGQVHRDQRGRAGGVDRDRRPLEAEGVGDATEITLDEAPAISAPPDSGRAGAERPRSRRSRRRRRRRSGVPRSDAGRCRRLRAPPRTTSSSSRCWGSSGGASRGLIPKKPASNSATSSMKPPSRT